LGAAHMETRPMVMVGRFSKTAGVAWREGRGAYGCRNSYAGGLLLNVDGRPTSIRPEQCLSYVLSLPVSTAVPGVRNADHMRAALRYCAARESERDHAPALEGMFHELEGHCVYCRHCFPCPANIPIDTAIMIVDWARMGVSDELRGWYAALPAKGSDCIQWDVIAKMERAVALFE